MSNFEVKNSIPAKTLCPACGEEAVRLDAVDLQHSISRLEAERDELENECNWLNGEVAKYVLEVDELRLQRDALDDENNDLQRRISELQEKLDWLTNHK